MFYVFEISHFVSKRKKTAKIERKNNKIKSIHSSLAIEANSLSLNQVKDVIEGKVNLGNITLNLVWYNKA